MAADYQIGNRCYVCRNCNRHDEINDMTFKHTGSFWPVSMSPQDGIDFEAHRFTTTQIADAFVEYIPNYTEWPIKQRAADRSDELIWELDTVDVRKFDLRSCFLVLDDFLFLGALKPFCDVRWVDGPFEKYQERLAGWCRPNLNIKGPRYWIELRRDDTTLYHDVNRTLSLLLHEMCHGLFTSACNCAVCRCTLNTMNAEGLSGHGPDFQRIRLVVEETLQRKFRYSWTSLDIIEVSDELTKEKKEKVKALGGLIEKLKMENVVTEQSKKAERIRKRLEDDDNTPEAEAVKQERDEVFEFMVSMFEEADLS
ncbi:hypothetical protein ACLMJK_002269 [Lecanora helva]